MGLSRFFRRRYWDRERARELDSYLEIETQDNMARGMSPDAARAAAHRKLGNLTSVREAIYEMNSLNFLETLWRDLGYALRVFAGNRAFTAVALLSIALGVGANTAIFSVLDAVLLRSLPVENPDQLVLLQRAGRSTVVHFSHPFFDELKRHDELVDGVLACFDANGTLQVGVGSPNGSQPAELARAQLVSGNYYSVLAVGAALGRTLTPEDDRGPDSAPVAVLSHGYWQRRFAGEPSALGKTVLLNGHPFAIAGVTPREFFGIAVGSPPDITVPLTMQAKIWLDPGRSIVEDHRFWWLRLMARLRPDVAESQARAGLTVLLPQIEAKLGVPPPPAGSEPVAQRIEFTPGSQGLETLRRRYSQPLLILMAVVALVLLIACANLATLLIARASVREREFAVRLALGAGRARLIRQLLTESTLLSLLGGCLGLILAWWAGNGLLAVLAQSPDPILLRFDLNARVLTFTAAVSLGTGIVFGLIPALQASRPDTARAMDRWASVSGKPASVRSLLSSGRLLVVLQIALSVVLLVGAGLFLRTMQNLKGLNPGFESANLLLARLDPTLVGYSGPQVADLYRALFDRFAALPGVQSVSFSSHGLVSPGIDDAGFAVRGYTPRPGERRGVNLNLVGPAYFETMRIPILVGRGLAERDDENSRRVAVISETLARQYFPGDNPVGRSFGWGGGRDDEIEIVGVAKDVKFNTLRDEETRIVYLPYRQKPVWRRPLGASTFYLRTLGDPEGFAGSVRAQVRAFDRNLPIVAVKTQNEQIENSLVQERLIAFVASGFGLLALFLVGVGLYGTMAHAVERRTKEIGIRMALGAQQSTLLWRLLREGLALVTCGGVLGLVGALATTRLTKSFLFGLSATDSTALLVAASLVFAIAALAAFVPAWRASRTDPAAVLRCE